MKEDSMNLGIWMSAMFCLGLAAMAVCFLFLEGCEKI
jgi:VIT1/CCC1 family predicted Fe2+/Mn2+ transporter